MHWEVPDFSNIESGRVRPGSGCLRRKATGEASPAAHSSGMHARDDITRTNCRYWVSETYLKVNCRTKDLYCTAELAALVGTDVGVYCRAARILADGERNGHRVFDVGPRDREARRIEPVAVVA